MTTTTLATPNPEGAHDDPFEGGRVVPFPTRPGTAEVTDAANPGTEIEPAPEVLDAELMTPADEAALDARRRAQLAIRQVGQVVRVGATHPHTRTAVRVTARTVVTIAHGHRSWAKHVIDVATHAHLREQVQSARAAGDQVALAEWHDRWMAAKHARHERIKHLPHTVWAALKAVLVIVTIAAGSLVVAGVGMEIFRPLGMDWDAWWGLLGDIAGLLGVVVTIAVNAVLWGAVPGWLWLAYRAGRQGADLPAWAAQDDKTGEKRDVIPDEGAIVNALRNLNLPALNKKFREGWRPRWVQGSVHDGKGWRTQLLLPEGVTVEMIVDRKPVLAHNLLRLPVEVWPTEPKGKPGVLDLWVADQGSLTKPVEPWPLLHEGTTDYFRGVPVGVNPQGKTVLGRLFQANWGAAGMPGSGKSTLIITMLLGAMLDPLVEIDVYCMAFNADYDPLKPRLRTLFKSDEPDEIPVVLDALKKLMSELSERGRKLSEAGEPKLTRKLAEADPTMRPRVVVIDECQELFVSDIGEEAAELVEKIVAKARKYGMTLVFATPVPSADSLPRKVAKVLSNRACFAIGDHQGNDAILGTGKHKAGITATTLKPMTEDSDGTVDPGDIGTAMTVGFMAADGLMRCYYPRRGDGVDEVTPVVNRALGLREEAGITPPPAVDTGQPVDHLADIHTVIGEDRRPRTAVVIARLIARNPVVYEDWTPQRLSAVLEDHGITVGKSNGQSVIRAEDVRNAITERDENAADEAGEDTGN